MKLDQFESLADAPFLHGVRAERLQRRQMQDVLYSQYVFAWAGRAAFGAFLGVGGTILGLLFLTEHVSGIPPANFWKISVPFAAAAFGVALWWAIDYRADLYDDNNLTEDFRFTERKKETTPMTDPTKTTLDLDNGMGAVVIWQPSAGAFAKWLHEAVHDGKYFSQAQALDRGWTVEQHNQLVHQLRSIGLIHPTQTERNAPVLTQHGAELAKKWLRMGV